MPLMPPDSLSFSSVCFLIISLIWFYNKASLRFIVYLGQYYCSIFTSFPFKSIHSRRILCLIFITSLLNLGGTHPGNVNCSDCMTKCIQSCEEWEQLVRFVGLEFIYEVFEECSFPIYFTSWCHPRVYCLLRTIRSKASLSSRNPLVETPAHDTSPILFIKTVFAAVYITRDSRCIYKSNKVQQCPTLSEIDTEYFGRSALKGSFRISQKSNSLTNLQHKIGDVF